MATLPINNLMGTNLDHKALFKVLGKQNSIIPKADVLPYIENPRLREIMDAFIDAHNANYELTKNSSLFKSLINWGVSFVAETGYNGPARSGLNLSAAMKRFTYLCDKYKDELEGFGIKYDPPLIDTFCKSGKDRTGLTEATSTWQSMNYKILNKELEKLQMWYVEKRGMLDPKDSYHKQLIDGLDLEYKKKSNQLFKDFKKTEQEFLDSQVNAKHTQTIPSLNAGTPGSHGVIDAMNRVYNPR
ncbi:hypothetical protein [Candidatus Bandiella euplotis]|uniref:Coat protein n=1 Tax=Candidatus Bandiella euplotis TaxID=1664265 RepID=A0ABZ0UJ97_9RICK|nr:hypothetical protein [Candidatus Bandiella woodruffii]WPX96171.1 hypothetical protein Bandiella_00280 [Candidatus Bandiella woodruffii]